LIDFHCHLDLYPEPHAVAAAAMDSGAYILSVTNTPSAWSGTSALAAGSKRIRTALGLHPALAHERRRELDLFDHLVGQTRYVGEVGLDGSPELKAHAGVQEEVFRRVLRTCSARGGRILSIHSRRAARPVLDLLRSEPDAGVPILHWFSGSAAELKRAVDQGCWFSIGPAMVRGRRGASLVASMPRDRILPETDGPFAESGDRPLLPGETGEVVAHLSKAWGEAATSVSDRLAENLKILGRLAGSDRPLSDEVA
jgi:TatD DNase family protein